MTLTSKEPDSQERQDVTEGETNGNSKATRTGFAALFMAIAIVGGLIGTWAAATHHYTTLIVAVIGGIIGVGLATWLGWPPKKIPGRTTDLLNKAAAFFLHSSQPHSIDDRSIPPDEPSETEIIRAEHDRLRQEHVRTKFELERLREQNKAKFETTKLQHNDPVNETPAKELTEEQVVYPSGFFNSGYGDRWTEYTEDTFYGVLWRWHYKPQIDNTPRGLTPLCPECDPPMPMTGHSLKRGRPFQYLKCAHHPQTYVINEKYDSGGEPFPKTKGFIKQKLGNGSWIDVVDKQRMPRGQGSIRGPIESPTENSPILKEMATQILSVLASEGGECGEAHLYAALDFLFTTPEQPEADRISVQYHLHELERENFIRIAQDIYVNTLIALTQKGRKYVLDRKLGF